MRLCICPCAYIKASMCTRLYKYPNANLLKQRKKKYKHESQKESQQENNAQGDISRKKMEAPDTNANICSGII